MLPQTSNVCFRDALFIICFHNQPRSNRKNDNSTSNYNICTACNGMYISRIATIFISYHEDIIYNEWISYAQNLL